MSAPTVPTGLLIGGEWLQTDQQLTVIDPATLGGLVTISSAWVIPSVRRDYQAMWSLLPHLLRR